MVFQGVGVKDGVVKQADGAGGGSGISGISAGQHHVINGQRSERPGRDHRLSDATLAQFSGAG